MQTITNYHPNGQKAEEYTITEDGKRNGLTINWDSAGNKLSETPYKDDRIHGVVKIYHANYPVNYEEYEYKNNVKDGPHKVYYSNKLTFQTTYKNDIVDGMCQGWHSNGNLSNEYYYKNQVLDGP